jgi:hypothetical protein
MNIKVSQSLRTSSSITDNKDITIIKDITDIKYCIPQIRTFSPSIVKICFDKNPLICPVALISVRYVMKYKIFSNCFACSVSRYIVSLLSRDYCAEENQEMPLARRQNGILWKRYLFECKSM